MIYENNTIKLLSRAGSPNTSDNVIHVDAINVDYNTGTLSSYKSWQVNPSAASFVESFSSQLYAGKMDNGNYCVYGELFGDYQALQGLSHHFAVLEFNKNDEFIKGYTINSALIANADGSSSIKIDKSGRVNLGPDQSFCFPDSVLLNAGKGYTSYEWQDGSVDSTFTVTKPWIYSIKVLDACGETFRDTINITAAPSFSIDLGPDRIKCNNDTIHLDAPSGFLNYTWSNDYSISSLTSQNVIVNPPVDTSYYIKAEKTTGCFAFDTVKISVHHSPIIDLGSDKNFCIGDSAVFDAGNGFTNYSWSTGSITQYITVKDIGSYSVMATTSEGCKSYDSVKVLNVFPDALVTLDHDSSLCKGSNRILDAGNFISYLWNNGSDSRTITINSTGVYAVSVTDNNGCKGTDTTVITNVLPSPVGFLPPDTTICSYGTLDIKPIKNFRNYLWSNNLLTSAITISKPGTYWLQVTDDNNCEGKDTVVVVSKDCLKGFYIPSAFTPNNDGVNDIFRPLLFGNVKKYQFTIYNRWSEKVFQTAEPGKGWDGIYSGRQQDTNIFLWICSYQLEGEDQKIEKGTVLLIR